MTAQGPFSDIFFKKDPHLNAAENLENPYTNDKQG